MTSTIAAALAVTIAFSGSPVELPTEAPVEETVAVEAIVEEAPAEAEVVADEAPVTVEEVAPEAAVEVAPVEGEEAVFAPFAAPALVDTTGLTPLGITGSRQVGPAEFIEFDRFMPQVRNAHISGLAKPETSAGTRPDEPVIDLRALVGTRGGPTGTEFQTSGFSYTYEGALFETPSETAPGVTGFSEMLDWAEYAWRIDTVGAVGLMNTADIDGRVVVVPFAENAEYGITATLVHIATGVEAAPITVTGFTGVNSGGQFDWAYSATPAAREGGAGMWSAQAGGYPEGRLMTNRDQRETIIGAGERTLAPLTPTMREGALSETGADFGRVAGFGLLEIDGRLTAGVPGMGLTARAGALYNEAIGSVSMDLAERFGDVVSVALPDAESGTLTLPPSGFTQPRGGLMYNATSGVTLSVEGTTVRADFGSPEWTNMVSAWVLVHLTDGTSEMREVAFESRPSDTSGGIVERRIPVSTELLITDAEMLEASRLSGLEPTVATINALDLPEGVSRVDGGFAYVGSEEPTTLSFGYRVSEVFETPSGPVVPDSAGDGEVRIAVVEGAVVPTDPEPETPVVVTPPTEVTPTPAPKPDTVTPSKAGPKLNPGANTGDEGFTAAAEEQDAGISNLVGVGAVGFFAAVLGAVAGWLFGRRKTARVKA